MRNPPRAGPGAWGVRRAARTRASRQVRAAGPAVPAEPAGREEPVGLPRRKGPTRPAGQELPGGPGGVADSSGPAGRSGAVRPAGAVRPVGQQRPAGRKLPAGWGLPVGRKRSDRSAGLVGPMGPVRRGHPAERLPGGPAGPVRQGRSAEPAWASRPAGPTGPARQEHPAGRKRPAGQVRQDGSARPAGPVRQHPAEQLPGGPAEAVRPSWPTRPAGPRQPVRRKPPAGRKLQDGWVGPAGATATVSTRPGHPAEQLPGGSAGTGRPGRPAESARPVGSKPPAERLSAEPARAVRSVRWARARKRGPRAGWSGGAAQGCAVLRYSSGPLLTRPRTDHGSPPLTGPLVLACTSLYGLRAGGGERDAPVGGGSVPIVPLPSRSGTLASCGHDCPRR